MKPTFEKPRMRIEVRERRNRWWIGVATLTVFAFVGTGLAIAVQAGMTFRYEDSPEILNAIFTYIGFPGKVAQYFVDGGRNIPTYDQRHTGELVCTIVNSIAYTAFMIAWFLRPDDNRLKR